MEGGIGVRDPLDSIRIDVDPKYSVTAASKSNPRCEPRRTEAEDSDTGNVGPTKTTSNNGSALHPQFENTSSAASAGPRACNQGLAFRSTPAGIPSPSSVLPQG